MDLAVGRLDGAADDLAELAVPGEFDLRKIEDTVS